MIHPNPFYFELIHLVNAGFIQQPGIARHNLNGTFIQKLTANH
jgi:hypothetical protein